MSPDVTLAEPLDSLRVRSSDALVLREEVFERGLGRGRGGGGNVRELCREYTSDLVFCGCFSLFSFSLSLVGFVV